VSVPHDSTKAAPNLRDISTQRVFVEHVTPVVEGSAYAVKRVLGDQVTVEADLVCDGHVIVRGRILYRQVGQQSWRTQPMQSLVNDRFRGSFHVDALGLWELRVEGCVDVFATWHRALERKLSAHQAEADLVAHLRQGGAILRSTVARVTSAKDKASEATLAVLRSAAAQLDAAGRDLEAARVAGEDRALLGLASKYPGFEHAGTSSVYKINVEPTLARFSAWYEFFPRSTGPNGKHGKLRDCGNMLRYAASLGFDVVYLPPIHPIGTSFRKGKDNSPTCEPSDPGSPWAIGGAAGGHKSIHPELGTMEDFRWFVTQARSLGLSVALDIAMQVSPEHPYVKEHPEWFAKRPDGTIQYAENPPKKYQDIYPFDFECEAAPALWRELTDIFLFWANEGVRVFRVDNPHTKSLPFWRFCVDELKQRYPDAILLAEAFTRPKLMYALAKLGFSQSYTYFTWRTTKYDLTEYMRELTQTDAAEFFRPNFWPNTPDILPEHLQHGGRGAFQARLILAATLSSNYGIYGPAYELMEHIPRPGAEEYANNEKYQLRHWDLDHKDSLRDLIQRINHIRRENPCLQDNQSLHFHPTDNDALLCYSKQAGDNTILCVVNLDPHHRQAGHVEVDLQALALRPDAQYQVHDLISEERHLWSGARNYVELDPHAMPAHVFVIRQRVRSEADFDYFM
jgi:starch synthase (maltosyl-transferring)